MRVIMHPDVLARLRNEDAKLLTDIEQKYNHTLSFRADPLAPLRGSSGWSTPTPGRNCADGWRRRCAWEETRRNS